MPRKLPATPAKPPVIPNRNVHPADELAAMREEIALLTKRADELRDILLKEGADLVGHFHTAQIQPAQRETLDRKAITEAFGEDAVAPFIKTTKFRVVKLVERTDAEA